MKNQTPNNASALDKFRGTGRTTRMLQAARAKGEEIAGTLSLVVVVCSDCEKIKDLWQSLFDESVPVWVSVVRESTPLLMVTGGMPSHFFVDHQSIENSYRDILEAFHRHD